MTITPYCSKYRNDAIYKYFPSNYVALQLIMHLISLEMLDFEVQVVEGLGIG